MSPSDTHNKYDKISNLHNEPKKKKTHVGLYANWIVFPSQIVDLFRKFKSSFGRIFQAIF